MIFALDDLVGWPKALDMAANYGLIPLLFVLLLLYVLRRLDGRIGEIERAVRAVGGVDVRLAQKLDELDVKWKAYIGPNPPIRITPGQAKQLIEIGLQRDTYDTLAFVASHALFEAHQLNDDALREKLEQRLWTVLKRTRDFFGFFLTDKGTLRTPLDLTLPLTTPDGDKRGDRLFREMIARVVSLLKSTDTHQAILAKIEFLANRRRQKTEILMLKWLHGEAILSSE